MGRQAREVHNSRSVSTFASVTLVHAPGRSATPNAGTTPTGGSYKDLAGHDGPVNVPELTPETEAHLIRLLRDERLRQPLER